MKEDIEIWKGLCTRTDCRRILIERKVNGWLVSIGHTMTPVEFLCTTSEEVQELVKIATPPC